MRLLHHRLERCKQTNQSTEQMNNSSVLVSLCIDFYWSIVFSPPSASRLPIAIFITVIEFEFQPCVVPISLFPILHTHTHMHIFFSLADIACCFEPACHPVCVQAGDSVIKLYRVFLYVVWLANIVWELLAGVPHCVQVVEKLLHRIFYVFRR